MDSLCQKYGYASDGESFSIADPNEVWLMELIGKGKEKGAVWVASKVCHNFAMTVYFMLNQLYTRTNIGHRESSGCHNYADVFQLHAFQSA